jgi:hypothetical protein
LAFLAKAQRTRKGAKGDVLNRTSPFAPLRVLCAFARNTVLLGLSLTACGEAPRDEPGAAPAGEVLLDPSAPVDPFEFEPSGRSLSGVFVEESPRAAKWTFTADGEYTRDREAGSYTIDAEGRLVLFVEQVGDRQYTTAERVIYGLDGDPAAGAITVSAPDGRTVRLVRTGAAPAPR